MSDLAAGRRITSLLIANRGEIACRIMRTCEQMGIATVAVYADGDRDALHVRRADQAVPLDGVSAVETYLDIAKVVAAARTSGADAIHPGYGFLAEREDFARAVIDAGLIWVGPPAAAIAGMGDKIAAKQAMAAAGVPVLPSTTDPADAGQIGYPLIVKAASGGGGKGMRIVREAADLDEAVDGARREAASAFGDDRVFLERLVERPRHIEVQVLADQHGRVVHLGERECSVQRRHQKVIEEAPSPAVDAGTRERLGEAAVAAASAVDYVGAGTVEFVATQPSADSGPSFFFLEMNTRLQVEHPVTELAWAVEGAPPLDLVRLQLEVAQGLPLPFDQDDLRLVAHAVEARLYAEDPATGFLPATGPVDLLVPANGPGTRWDTGVETGDVIGPHFDPMLAKVIAHGATRPEAIRRLSAELSRTRLHGLRTNRDALVGMLGHPDLLDGALDTGFIDRLDDAVVNPTADGFTTAVHLVAATVVGRERRIGTRRVQGSVPAGYRNNRSASATVGFRQPDGSTATVSYVPAERSGAWLMEVTSRGPAGGRLPAEGDTRPGDTGPGDTRPGDRATPDRATLDRATLDRATPDRTSTLMRTAVRMRRCGCRSWTSVGNLSTWWSVGAGCASRSRRWASPVRNWPWTATVPSCGASIRSSGRPVLSNFRGSPQRRTPRSPAA